MVQSKYVTLSVVVAFIVDGVCVCVCVDDDEVAFWSVFLTCFWLDDSQGVSYSESTTQTC